MFSQTNLNFDARLSGLAWELTCDFSQIYRSWIGKWKQEYDAIEGGGPPNFLFDMVWVSVASENQETRIDFFLKYMGAKIWIEAEVNLQ